MKRVVKVSLIVLQLLLLTSFPFAAPYVTENKALVPDFKCSCRNGGSCISSLNNASALICSCPADFEGENCETKITECPDHLDDCTSGGSCRLVNDQRECICPISRLGPRCELPNICVTQSPCRNGGTCSIHLDGGETKDVSLAYKCQCPLGFDGTRCEKDVDECSHQDHRALSACVHGVCVNMFGSFRCDCYDGYRGKMCELRESPCERQLEQCRNNGSCQIRRNGQAYCQCPIGFTGEFCQFMVRKEALVTTSTRVITTIDTTTTTTTTTVATTTTAAATSTLRQATYQAEVLKPINMINYNQQVVNCASQKCDAKANGRCDEECAYIACSYDNGECSFGVVPFKQCFANRVVNTMYYYRPCDQVFADGICDAHCNTENCLFDGFDCAPISSSSLLHNKDFICSTHCAGVYANNVCDYECNSAECAWDGADCRESSIVGGYIALTVNANSPFVSNLVVRNALLRDISLRVQLVARSRGVVELNETHVDVQVAFHKTHCEGWNCFKSIDYVGQLLTAHIVIRHFLRTHNIVHVQIYDDAYNEVESASSLHIAEAQTVVASTTEYGAPLTEDYRVALYALIASFFCLLIIGLIVMIVVIRQVFQRRQEQRRLPVKSVRNSARSGEFEKEHYCKELLLSQRSFDSSKQQSDIHSVSDRLRCDDGEFFIAKNLPIFQTGTDASSCVPIEFGSDDCESSNDIISGSVATSSPRVHFSVSHIM